MPRDDRSFTGAAGVCDDRSFTGAVGLRLRIRVRVRPYGSLLFKLIAFHIWVTLSAAVQPIDQGFHVWVLFRHPGTKRLEYSV